LGDWCILRFRLWFTDGRRVDTLDVGMRWSDTCSVWLRNFVALGIDQASSGFIAGFEADFSFEGFDLFRIQEITVLVSVLNLLFSREDALPSW
jgi:hypothetical protein